MVTYAEDGLRIKEELRLVNYTEVLPLIGEGLYVFVCVTLTGIGHLPPEVKFQNSVFF